jgi:hypothetical protein
MLANVELKGIEPGLLMHRPITESFLRKIGIKGGKIGSPEEEALAGAYWRNNEPESELVIPADCFMQCFINSSKNFKVGKKSATSSFIASAPLIQPFEIGLGTNKYDVDVRTVVIKGRGRIIRGRALIKKWKVAFTIDWSEEYFADASIMEAIIKESGRRVGIMDYRPTCRGFFGRFEMIKFEIGKAGK